MLKEQWGSRNLPELSHNPIGVFFLRRDEPYPSKCQKTQLWELLKVTFLGTLHPPVKGVISPRFVLDFAHQDLVRHQHNLPHLNVHPQGEVFII